MSNFVLLADVWGWISPLWLVAAGSFASVIAIVLAYFLVKLVSSKVAAIALTTLKEALAQPLFYVAIALGVVGLLVSPFIPYFTLGEDIKMVKDTGLTIVMLLAIFVALWNAGISVANEIEGKTALTLLSKPVGRHQFILGKFLGIVFSVAVMFVLLGAIFLSSISYKVVYDARENARSMTPIEQSEMCHAEIKQIAPGLVLAFFEAVIFVAIGVALSTRLPILPNLIIGISIYLLGHIVPTLLQSDVGAFPLVQFMGQFIAVIFPVLDHFNVQTAVSTGSQVPTIYLFEAFGYCAIYCLTIMLLALLSFEDRDLA